MRRELLAIGLISLALFVLGNICTGLVMEAGNTQLDLTHAFIGRLSQARVLYFEPLPLSVGAACACAVWLVWVRWWERRGSYRKGEEHGSARWATASEMVAFSDKGNPDNNIILTASARKRLEDTAHDQRTETNNNVLVVGGPGTGMTRYYVKPNLMQANASFFITDPKGTLIHDMGWVLEWLGYEIKTFDTVDFSRSMHFNPIAYIKDEAGLLRFVECLIRNTTAEGKSATDPFWVNAEKLLYTALVTYLLDHCPEEDRNIPGLLSLLALADAREDDEGYLSPLDMLFKELETGRRLMKVSEGSTFDPSSRAFTTDAGDWAWVKVAEPVRPEDDFALSSYKQFKVAAGKTLKSIMISCNVRMKPFDIAEMRELLRFDEMALDHMGDANAKVAVFASMSDTDSTFDFVFALLMQQALDTLCECALKRFAGRLPRCVHFVFDEFANIGTIPDFDDHGHPEPQHRRVHDLPIPLAARRELRREQRGDDRERLRHDALPGRQVGGYQPEDRGDDRQADGRERLRERLSREQPHLHAQLRPHRARPHAGLRDLTHAQGRGARAHKRGASVQGQEVRAFVAPPRITAGKG